MDSSERPACNKGQQQESYPIQHAQMKTNTLRKDVDGSTALNSESDQESSIDIVDDDDSRSRTPEDAESISTGDGLVVMRPPKPSNADLRTAEVFEVGITTCS